MSDRGKYFEDFVVGEKFVSPGRTVTEADVALYAGLSGDYNQLHTDEEYCQSRSIYKTRIAHGLFGLTITEGLKSRVGLFEGTSLATLEWNWKFKKAILIGDTITVKWKIAEKRETSKPDRGIIREEVHLFNQNSELLGEGIHTVMMQRKKTE